MSAFRNLKRAIKLLTIPYPFTPAAEGDTIRPIQQSTMNVADGQTSPNIPKHVYEVLVQAKSQNINYTLDGTPATNTDGFQLVAGNDPIAIPIIVGRTELSFAAQADGAVLVLQWGE